MKNHHHRQLQYLAPVPVLYQNAAVLYQYSQLRAVGVSDGNAERGTQRALRSLKIHSDDDSFESNYSGRSSWTFGRASV